MTIHLTKTGYTVECPECPGHVGTASTRQRAETLGDAHYLHAHA